MLLVPDSVSEGVARCTAAVAACNAVPERLMPEWLALAEDAAEPNAFGEAWFVAPALDQLREDRTVWIVEVRDEADLLAGVMPVAIEPRYGRIPVRHTSNWTHFQCFMGTPLIREGFETSFWHAMLEMLDASDWAPGFLSVSGLFENGAAHAGLRAAAARLDRPAATVHRYARAALQSRLSPEVYLAETLRGKKRKELRRLSNRLAEMGSVRFATLDRADELSRWCDDFLALESAGWKGSRGSAFANEAATTSFFRQVIAGAFDAGRLDFQRLDLDGRAIAMLVNFRTPPGSWSFKIAYDEEFARFSPGVLIEIENLPRVLGDPEIDWMDSCAVEDHPMINALWMERRAIVQVSVPLSGMRRRATYSACRSAERASAALRSALGKN